jgi:hypothetical protein
MPGYYDEILDEIKNLIDEEKYEDAMAIVKRELDMPYIPPDTEPELRKLKRDLVYDLGEKEDDREESLNSLLNGLKGKPQAQLAAASRLTSRNLREILPELKDYLGKDPQPEAAALLIEAIAEQDIQDEFTLRKTGVEYNFYGDSVVPPSKSKGFLKADRLLQDWLEMKNPGLYQMARTLLIHDVYMFLPLSYEEDEAEELAKEMVSKTSELMDDPDIMKFIK